jgi:protein associated with RNAse G/E
MRDPISVRVLKYDGREYRRWQALTASQNGSLIVLDAEFDTDVAHDLLGQIRRGTRTIEYYWLDRWYNIFRFLEADGSTQLWYCNINMPPEFEQGVLTYVDLDIDVLVRPDFSYELLDMQEFQENAARYGYSAEVNQGAQHGLSELRSIIENRQFPFSE